MQPIRIQQATSDLELNKMEMRRFWPDALASYHGKRLYQSKINGLILGQSSFSDNATVVGLEISRLFLSDCVLLSIPIAGHSSHSFRGKTYQASGKTAVLQPALDLISCKPLTDVRTFQVILRTAGLDAMIAHYVGDAHRNKAHLLPEINLDQALGKTIAGLTARMIDWLNSPTIDLEANALLLNIFEQRFIQAVVEYQAQAWPFLDRCPAAEPYYIAMAEELIRHRLREPISLGELAIACGVSGRSLQLGFQKHRGFSPMEFHRRLRLEGARNDLLSPKQATAVTQIALKWGFGHLGRFASLYQMRFRECPSETLRKSRAQG